MFRSEDTTVLGVALFRERKTSLWMQEIQDLSNGGRVLEEQETKEKQI